MHSRRPSRHTLERGVVIERGVQAIGVHQDDSAVRIAGRRPDGIDEWRGKYLIAAAGAHSSVRQLTGQQFPGRSILRSVVLADAHLDTPAQSLITVNAVKECFPFLASFSDGKYRIITWDRHNQQDRGVPVGPDALRSMLNRTMGTYFGMKQVEWTSRFHCDERQMVSYRAGRVLFCGNVAHAHSPAGGQGTDTGIQDAVNLGWKLAAVLDGADDSLLDTSEAERHPVGRLVLRASGAMIRAMVIRPMPLRLLRTALLRLILLLRPTASRPP
ncbi:FAD-dependent monooxygenase [Streptomyces chartreusis]|uniref:FAD-dependent monooxygenase n=1 Tax=Streptomyces chartreusis TaxID=1969 RepID=UPI0036917495